LNNWIDLIFGNKQEGKEAESNYNVYFYLTNERTSKIENAAEEVVENVINQMFYYGVSPKIIFNKSHVIKNKIQRQDTPIQRKDNPVAFEKCKFIFNCDNEENDTEAAFYIISVEDTITRM
jgi:Beige/BEACH domain